jgi:hypothetical protein
MKKLLLTLVSVMVLGSAAVFAGESKSCCSDKEKEACSDKDKAACTDSKGAASKESTEKKPAAQEKKS